MAGPRCLRGQEPGTPIPLLLGVHCPQGPLDFLAQLSTVLGWGGVVSDQRPLNGVQHGLLGIL